MDDTAARERVARVETLLEEVESLRDPSAREKAAELVQALVELYGEGLARIVGTVPDPEPLAEDELVAHLLLLHDLHPVPLERRVQGALEEVRPYLESHGGDVELVAVEEGVVRLRLNGSCSGCPASTMTLKLAIEDAIHKAAPEVESVEAEGVVEEEAPAAALLQLEIKQPARSWTTAGSLAELNGGGAVVKRVAGEELLFVKLHEAQYAYRRACAGCGAKLDEAALDGPELACPECQLRYDVRRAGRCLDQPQLHLEPVPLLAGDEGLVKVALGAAA